MPPRPFTIGRVAALTGLTVRALHHYDDIGLVSPSQRSHAGYRLYTDDDLHRLQQVLLFRELGFALDIVRDLIDAPPEQRRAALIEQRATLQSQLRHGEAVLKAVDATLQTLDGDRHMSTGHDNEHLFDGYAQFRNGEYAREARARWGDTDHWKISQTRTARYSKDDWARIQVESDAITHAFLDTMQRGDPADGETAMALAESHREHIERYFYPCNHEMHASVAAMYTADLRFQAHYDRHGEGLAGYIEAAVRANAARHGA
ncbi:MAG: MerR family transcriptional regulator [Xanthomonadaceae bacterium]|nr:MerR family transcriptional regulator [Xanthomonadaceae bacterium]